MTKKDETGHCDDRQKPDPWLGRVIAGRYKVQALLAQGGMGRIYRGSQSPLDRPVAIKCIHPHLASAPDLVARFMAEARLASRLAHPNIVRIYDFGRTDDADGACLYLVMEFLDGTDLGTVLSKVRAVPFAWTVQTLLQVLDGLSEAHAHGVTHYDIKPENIVITKGALRGERIKVIDFGVARMHGARAEGQGPHLIMGTPQYMCPELVRGEEAHVTADLYAVGAVLFQVLTGQRLFDGDTAMRVLQQQLSAPRPDPRRIAPKRNIPAKLAELCLKAIALDPADRFQSAEEFHEALADFLDSLSRKSSPARTMTASALPTMPPSCRDPSLIPISPRPSERYRVVHRRIDLAVLHRLDTKIAESLSSGNHEAARALLEEGVKYARELSARNERELASVAWRAFGGRLAAALRSAGQSSQAEALLEEALDQTTVDEETRTALRHDLERTRGTPAARGRATPEKVDVSRLTLDFDDLTDDRESAAPNPLETDDRAERSSGWRMKGGALEEAERGSPEKIARQQS